MATKKLTTKPLSAASKARIAELRAAHARGENTAAVTARSLSRKELASQLRRHAA